jgi:hypothetical protein
MLHLNGGSHPDELFILHREEAVGTEQVSRIELKNKCFSQPCRHDVLPLPILLQPQGVMSVRLLGSNA